MTATIDATSDPLTIAHSVKLKPIPEVAAMMGLAPDDIEMYGANKAKIKLEVLDRLRDRPNAKYIVVTAITPTPLGEGKTTTSIGLAQGMYKIGKKAVVALRQPSMGPVFGIKGGGSGGGFSQVVPMEDINLHLTGDIHAVGAAHNLLTAFMDASIFHGNPLKIDINRIELRHVVDVLDRSLRQIVQGLGGRNNGVPRESGFDITVASEVMAILALAKDIFDLRERLGRMVVGYDMEGHAVTAEQLKAAGSMAVILHEAIKPNLLQTLEGTPALVHCGPFANIAHGNSSVIADYIGMKCTDYLITEAGFGADMGFEKFCDIKCRVSGLRPDAAVIVATVRALKMHSGRFNVVAGKPLDPGLTQENLGALEEGLSNLVAHIEFVRKMGLPAVVAINSFPTDTDAECALIERVAKQAGAVAAVPSTHFSDGGAGAADLAQAVVEALEEQTSNFDFLYPLDMSIKEKINTIATKCYGAKGVEYSEDAESKIRTYTKQGFDKLPICMAKTHLSLSHDPKLKGRPTGFILPIRDVRLSAGAGFIYPLCGTMLTMPGLPHDPAGAHMDIDEQGQVVGLH